MTDYKKLFENLIVLGIPKHIIRHNLCEFFTDFPSWNEYKILYEGDEFDTQEQFFNDYENTKYNWFIESEKVKYNEIY